MKISTLAIALTLTACATPQPSEIIPVHWIRYSTQTEVDQACKSDPGLIKMKGRFKLPKSQSPDTSVLGCYRQTANGTCQIITTKPQAPHGTDSQTVHRVDARLLQTIGHEIVHCFTGNFHTD